MVVRRPRCADYAEIATEILTFINGAGVKTVAMTDRIIGCPHEEGIDYEGPTCPRCRASAPASVAAITWPWTA